MNNKLEIAQHKFTESIGKLAESFGLNKFMAQLYAVLYLSDRPLSLDELVDKLKVSKGNISLNIRTLEEWGAVKSVWVKGSRKDYYEAEQDIRKAVANKLKSSMDKRIAQVSGMLDEFKQIVASAETELTDEEKKVAKRYREQVKKIEDMKDAALNMLNLAGKFLL